VVRHELFSNISRKNVGPGLTPSSSRKDVIIGAQFFFNVSRQRRAEPAVTGINTFVATKILGEFDRAFLRLKPGHFRFDRAQYFTGHTHCERPNRFIASDSAIPKLRRCEADAIKKLRYHAATKSFLIKWPGNELGAVSLRQLDPT